MKNLFILVATLVLIVLPAIGAPRAGPSDSNTTLDYIFEIGDGNIGNIGNILHDNDDASGHLLGVTLSADEGILIAGGTDSSMNYMNDDWVAHRAREVMRLAAADFRLGTGACSSGPMRNIGNIRNGKEVMADATTSGDASLLV